MASGGKRSGGERVLESRHVIGLFLLMLLFSGVFFALGYRMGLDQYSGQVRAASDVKPKGEGPSNSRSEPTSAKGASPEIEPPPSDSPASNPFWEANKSREPGASLTPLQPAAPAPRPAKSSKPGVGKEPSQAKSSGLHAPGTNAPLFPAGAYYLQVAALTRQSDAVDLAAQLQKKKFLAYVLPARTDKYYRIQVGPFADRKAADSVRKGLEGAGFKAIVKH